jgi:CspA family cold shock protein
MDRGYGFINKEDEKDLFFHRNDIEEVEFDNLREGQQVEFEVGQGRDGRYKAVRVRVTEPQGD